MNKPFKDIIAISGSRRNMFFRPAQGAIKSAPSHRGAQKRCESARQLSDRPLQLRVGHAHLHRAVKLAGGRAEAYVMFPPVGSVDDIQDHLLRVRGNSLFPAVRRAAVCDRDLQRLAAVVGDADAVVPVALGLHPAGAALRNGLIDDEVPASGSGAAP